MCHLTKTHSLNLFVSILIFIIRYLFLLLFQFSSLLWFYLRCLSSLCLVLTNWQFHFNDHNNNFLLLSEICQGKLLNTLWTTSNNPSNSWIQETLFNFFIMFPILSTELEKQIIPISSLTKKIKNKIKYQRRNPTHHFRAVSWLIPLTLDGKGTKPQCGSFHS